MLKWQSPLAGFALVMPSVRALGTIEVGYNLCLLLVTGKLFMVASVGGVM